MHLHLQPRRNSQSDYSLSASLTWKGRTILASIRFAFAGRLGRILRCRGSILSRTSPISTQSSTMATVPSALSSAPAPAQRKKLTGRAFYESLGSPKMILAPMVDQSEFVRGFYFYSQCHVSRTLLTSQAGMATSYEIIYEPRIFPRAVGLYAHVSCAAFQGNRKV